jgi:hypothetical protein
MCLINHSCLPNTHNSWNSTEEHEAIHAIQPIQKGEEITIQHDHGGPSKVRQAFLKEAFGFACTCNSALAYHPRFKKPTIGARKSRALMKPLEILCV